MSTRFEAGADTPTSRFSRRAALRTGGVGAVAGLTSSLTRSVDAQDSTPVATPLAPREASMDVIPLPRSTTVTAGAPLAIAELTGIAAEDRALQPIADWLAEEAATLASLELSATGGSDPAIVLSLDEGLPSGQATVGIRADGVAPDGERYRLDVSEARARIVGATPEGVFRGAATLLQLLAQSAGKAGATLDAVSVADAPRFAWRGLSVDVARTFYPVDTLKRVIDLMALYKMNVLHLHLTDNEGWRFEVPAWPDLTARSDQPTANDHPGGTYTQDAYAEMLAYAAARFITVVPEFDSPGHTASILRAYPQLGTDAMHAAPESLQYLDPTVAGVWNLVQAVFDEMARVHPGGRLHIGGDEAIAMPDEAFAAYVEAALAAARSTGKGIVAWQETARAGFAHGDVMQLWISPQLVERVLKASEDLDNSWVAHAFPDPAVRDAFVRAFLRAPEDLPNALAQGASVLISRADTLYLDTRYAEDSSDPAQADLRASIGLSPSVYGSGTVQDAFDWDPATIEPDLPLERIAGVEGAIWSDTITDEHELMFQLLPRLPGVAEKGWSEHGSWAEYLPRLAAQRRMWNLMGATYFVSSLVWPEG